MCRPSITRCRKSRSRYSTETREAGASRTPLVETAPGRWECFKVFDGLFQGFCEATSVFALALRRALLNAAKRAAASGIELHILSYVDDTYINLPPDAVKPFLDILVKHLLVAGLVLQLYKCCVWAPFFTDLQR